MKNLSAEFLGNAVRIRCEPDTYELYQQWETSRRYVRAAGMLMAPGALNDDQWSLDLVSFIKTAPYDLLCSVMLGILSKSVRWDIGLLRNMAATRRDTAELAARRIKQEARQAAARTFRRAVEGLYVSSAAWQIAEDAENEAFNQADSDYQAACEAIDYAYQENIRADYLALITGTVRYTD